MIFCESLETREINCENFNWHFLMLAFLLSRSGLKEVGPWHSEEANWSSRGAEDGPANRTAGPALHLLGTEESELRHLHFEKAY